MRHAQRHMLKEGRSTSYCKVALGGRCEDAVAKEFMRNLYDDVPKRKIPFSVRAWKVGNEFASFRQFRLVLVNSKINQIPAKYKVRQLTYEEYWFFQTIWRYKRERSSFLVCDLRLMSVGWAGSLSFKLRNFNANLRKMFRIGWKKSRGGCPAETLR